ncbi:hypothetical protein B0H19DRAFT_1084418 [Mycena capillaripes]|nr:hypothetical protein B0H19DRAFT_1084418 [Mycena capillaripes]
MTICCPMLHANSSPIQGLAVHTQMRRPVLSAAVFRIRALHLNRRKPGSTEWPPATCPSPVTSDPQFQSTHASSLNAEYESSPQNRSGVTSRTNASYQCAHVCHHLDLPSSSQPQFCWAEPPLLMPLISVHMFATTSICHLLLNRNLAGPSHRFWRPPNHDLALPGLLPGCRSIRAAYFPALKDRTKESHCCTELPSIVPPIIVPPLCLKLGASSTIQRWGRFLPISSPVMVNGTTGRLQQSSTAIAVQ